MPLCPELYEPQWPMGVRVDCAIAHPIALPILADTDLPSGVARALFVVVAISAGRETIKGSAVSGLASPGLAPASP